MEILNIGDKVRFLNDVGGGTIVKILPKNQILVRDENDFEYPVLASEIVVVEKAADQSKKEQPATNSANIAEKAGKPKVAAPKVELKKETKTSIIFAFIRNEHNDRFDAFLVNDSNYFLFYNIVLLGENGYEKIDTDLLEPNTKVLVGDISRNQINFSREIIVQITPYNNPKCYYHAQIERRIKITPIKFFQEHSFIANDFFDQKAYIIELFVEDLGLGNSIKTQAEFESQIARKDLPEEDNSQRYHKRPKPETIEVDLHINKLLDSVVGLSNSEILNIQLDKFHKTMTDAILRKAAKVVVIHGIGNGTLKANIRQSLEKQYKLPYEDASFREYGFGATLVLVN